MSELTVATVDALLVQLKRDRGTLYWGEPPHVDSLDGAEAWLLSLRDFIEHADSLAAPTPADVPGQGEIEALAAELGCDYHDETYGVCSACTEAAERLLDSPWLAERDAEVARRAVDERESYTIAQIRAAFAKHARPDDWNIRAFYERGLIAALRGEWDTEERP